MSLDQKDWLSLTQASDMLGVHPSTLRRWADSGSVPCLRTPGGHRRFRAADLTAWLQTQQTAPHPPPSETLVQNVVEHTRQEMALQRVSDQAWYVAFQRKERQEMRHMSRELLNMAFQYIGHAHDPELLLQEGRRIGEFFGQQCAQHKISLVDTVRAQLFFYELLLQAAWRSQAGAGQPETESLRIHQQLRRFLEEIMYACLASYERTCRHLLANPA